MDTISKLWSSELVSACTAEKEKEEIKKVKALLLRNRAELDATLNEQQKKKCENCWFCMEEQLLIMNEEAFCRGFSLGLKLTAEALSE